MNTSLQMFSISNLIQEIFDFFDKLGFFAEFIQNFKTLRYSRGKSLGT